MGENSGSNGFHIDTGEDMSQYKKDALSVVSFKIVYEKDDMVSKSDYFKPLLAHQIFGDSESIFGYRSLSIYLYYLHNSVRCYVDIQKSMEVKNKDLYKPDDIMQNLEPWLPAEFTTEEDEFHKMIENEKHNLFFGNVLAVFEDKKETRSISGKTVRVNYKITKCEITDKNFQKFHRRFETFIFWYIDGANIIDLNDDRWVIYYVYEAFEHPETKETYISPVGYCTVYRFYAFPNNIRTRISQFFVLPPYQRRGIGSQLYHTVVNDIRKMPEVVDITVEEPTSIFQKIRDFEDCVTMYKELKKAGINICATNTKKLFEFMKKQKICKRQSLRIYDILSCYEASKGNPKDYKKHFANIKDRLTTDIEKETRGSKRICNLERAGVIAEPADKDAQLESEYKKYINDIEPSIKYLQRHFGQ